MPRPSKHERDALKASGNWPPASSKSATPSNLDLFCQNFESELPQPGSFGAIFDPTVTPSEFYFETGNLFGDLPEMCLDEECDLGAYASLSSAGSFRELMSGSHAAAAAKIACTSGDMAVREADPGVFPPLFPFLVPEDPHQEDLPPLVFPPVVAERLDCFGEFLGPDGLRWKIGDPSSNQKSLVRTSGWFLDGVAPDLIQKNSWLPVSPEDGRCRSIVAAHLRSSLASLGVRTSWEDLRDKIFGGTVPSCLVDNPQVPTSVLPMLTFFFHRWISEKEFSYLFSSTLGFASLRYIGLSWDAPSAGHFFIGGEPKELILHLLVRWVNFCAIHPVYSEGEMSIVDVTLPGIPSQLSHVVKETEMSTLSSWYDIDDGERIRWSFYGTPISVCVPGYRHSQNGRTVTSPVTRHLARVQFLT